MAFSLISGISIINLLSVFLWVALSSLGIPGALIFLISSGALANNFLELILIIIFAVFGGIIGDIFAYELARRLLSRLSVKLQKFKFYRDNEEKARNTLQNYEFSFVFFTRFALSGLGAVVSYISGFEKINRKKFILAVILGEIIYGTMYPLLGFFFKQTWNDLSSLVQDALIILTLIIIVVFLIVNHIRRKRRNKNASISVLS
jgi:membrane protein DedA with SNARE-associated domain